MRKLTVVARSKKADKDMRMQAAYRDLLEQAEQVIAKAETKKGDRRIIFGQTDTLF